MNIFYRALLHRDNAYNCIYVGLFCLQQLPLKSNDTAGKSPSVAMPIVAHVEVARPKVEEVDLLGLGKGCANLVDR